MGFTDFDPPAELLPATTSPAAAAEPSRQPRRDEFYDMPIVDGKPVPNTLLTRLRDQLRALLMSSGEREEAQLESSLRRLPGVSRTNVVATVSPKGGCGKTTSTFLAGNVLASHLRLRALAVDLNPDFGTLADLAPDRARAPLSLVDLLREKEQIGSPGELRPYVSRLPSGLHLLAAPPDPAVMAQMTPELYGGLLSFLRRFYYDTAATSNFVQMQNLKTLVGLNQMVLGADHPYGEPLTYIQDLRDLEASGVLTLEDRRNIERGNMVRLIPQLNKT
jgi:hypothetical protein